LSSFLARLSDREKKLVGILALAFLVVVVGGGLWWSGSALDQRRSRVESIRQALSEILTLESEYREAEAA
jgi:hypothetical protein